ncbi:hypothetical protein BDN67DRAFT_974953, partial [Paxillus ammoniavirescens]
MRMPSAHETSLARMNPLTSVFLLPQVNFFSEQDHVWRSWMFQLWRLCVVFRVVRFAFLCMSFVRTTKDLAIMAMAILHLSYLHLFVPCAVCGADVDRCVHFCFAYLTAHIIVQRLAQKNRN